VIGVDAMEVMGGFSLHRVFRHAGGDVTTSMILSTGRQSSVLPVKDPIR
jgi:hypothetical protein